jgi:hypothetical protein
LWLPEAVNLSVNQTMKNNILNRTISVLCMILLFAISSCEYQPKGLFEVDVKPVTEAPALQVDLNFESDTLYLPFDKNITFRYSVSDALVRYAFYSINGQQLAKVDSNSGVFSTSFSSGNYQKNTAYKLKVELFRSSGSNSLADKLLNEGFLYSKEITYFLRIITEQVTYQK